jgi:hypothetical protein
MYANVQFDCLLGFNIGTAQEKEKKLRRMVMEAIR